MKPYRRQKWQRNVHTVAWHKYFPSNRVPGGPTEDDIKQVKSPVKNWLDGSRPNPSGEITRDNFAGPGKQFGYVELDEYKRLNIRLSPRFQSFQKLWLFYNSKECYFVCENYYSHTKYTSKTYGTRKEALLNHEADTVSWVKMEPLRGEN